MELGGGVGMHAPEGGEGGVGRLTLSNLDVGAEEREREREREREKERETQREREGGKERDREIEREIQSK